MTDMEKIKGDVENKILAIFSFRWKWITQAKVSDKQSEMQDWMEAKSPGVEVELGVVDER